MGTSVDVYDAIGQALTQAGVGPSSGGLWDGIAATVDVAEQRPRLAPDIEVKYFALRWGNDYVMVANPRDLIHYRLDPTEAALLRLLDGERTVREILVERLQESGDMELSTFADLLEQLRREGFLDRPFVDVEAAVGRAIDPLPRWRQRLRRFLSTLTIDWRGAHPFVAWTYRHGVRWFFLPWVAIASGIVALVGLAAFFAVPDPERFALSAGSAAAASLIILVLNYLLTFVHELAHATALVHYGRRVKAAGFMIYFGSPAFFVEASDSLMLERGQRIVQSFAGPFSELILAGAASIVAWGFPDSAAAPILYKWALINYVVIFLNLVPLLELDGYWILSDLIQVPDLRPRSLQFVRYDLWRKLRRGERFRKQEVGLALYGILGVAFTILAVVTSLYFWEVVFGDLVRKLWDGGLITRILLIVLVLFVAGPVIRGLIALARMLGRKVRAMVQAVRFRLQTRWRVEAARLIDALPMLEDLPEDVLSDLAGRVQLRRSPAGKPVFRQGDEPSAFYIVRSGTFVAVEEDPDTDQERVIRTLGRGESFGELALVDHAPRSATVRAVRDGVLFEVDRGTFDRLLADMAEVPEFAPTLQAAAELRRLPVFGTLGSDDLAEVLSHGSWVNVHPGEDVVRQGEEGDAFYAVGSGRISVAVDGREVHTLGPGSYFGEIALLSKAPRTATVTARTPLRLFRLDAEGFERVIAGAFRRGTLNPADQIERPGAH